MLEVYFGDRNKKRYKDESVNASRSSSGISDCFGSQSAKLSDSKKSIVCHVRNRSQSETQENGSVWVCSGRPLFREGLWKEEEGQTE